MAYKEYGHKMFSFNGKDGQTIFIYCFSQNTRYGFRHVADFHLPGEASWRRAKCCYYNRTWERFKYESVLCGAADKCPKDIAGAIRAGIEDIANGARRKAEADFQEFKAAYDSATPGMKEALKGATITTEEDARGLTAALKAANVLRGLLK